MRRWQSDVPIDDRRCALRALREGELTVAGRVTEASNLVLWCELRVPWALPRGAESLHAVYKPIRGERPLADFPTGTLALREEAAWHVSEVTRLVHRAAHPGPRRARRVGAWSSSGSRSTTTPTSCA